MLKLLLIGALATGAFTPAQQPHQTPSGPYSRLFTGKPMDTTEIKKTPPTASKQTPKPTHFGALELPSQHGAQPRVERGACNMPIIVADASIDPGILIIPKTHDKPKIRAIEPPACWTK